MALEMIFMIGFGLYFKTSLLKFNHLPGVTLRVVDFLVTESPPPLASLVVRVKDPSGLTLVVLVTRGVVV